MLPRRSLGSFVAIQRSPDTPLTDHQLAVIYSLQISSIFRVAIPRFIIQVRASKEAEAGTPLRQRPHALNVGLQQVPH